MLSELEISKLSMSGLHTQADERLPIVCGPLAIAAVTGAPMRVRFLHPQRQCREGQTEDWDREPRTKRAGKMKTFSLAGMARAKFTLMRDHSSRHGVGDVQGREKGPGGSCQGQVEEW
jgi:hypothetical protein